MHGKLIVFEGIDGSGKSTQYARLCSRLDAEGIAFHKVIFPRYDKESSALLRMYLNGEFGSRPSDVNAFAASTFFAVDRFASFKTDWGQYYDNGGLVLSDRYTTSNACHQGSKLPDEELPEFLDWLYHFEYDLLGLPRPDLVIYLRTELEVSLRRLRQRESETHTSADIHEKDSAYLRQCLRAGNFAAQHYGWHIVDCVRDGTQRPVEDIHGEIFSLVRQIL